MLAIIGFLMFGNDVHNEITRNLFLTKGYPEALSVCIAIFIAVLPLTKAPLKSASLSITGFNVYLLLTLQEVHARSSALSRTLPALTLEQLHLLPVWLACPHSLVAY